jgi:hypothetical protein
MEVSIYRMIWSRRRVFVAAASLVFLCSATVILNLPLSYNVKSSIEIASTLVAGRLQPIEAPDQVAKRATDRYFPSALLKLESQGASSSELMNLQSLKADAIGPEIILSSKMTSGEEGNYKLLQEDIANQIVESHAALSRSTRELLAINISSAKRSAQNLEQQLNTTNEEFASLKERVASQVNSLQIMRDEFRQRINAAKREQNSMSGEAEIRELRERIGSAETMSRDGDAAIARLYREQSELRRLREEQLRNIANSELELSAITPSRVTLSPSKIPVPVGARKALLLVSALISSLVFALIIVFIVDRTKGGSEKVPMQPQPESAWGELAGTSRRMEKKPQGR